MKNFYNPKMILTKEQKTELVGMRKKTKTAHDALLKMLVDIDLVIKKTGIKYSLHAGTALGSVLYKDFIPWDDDIDLAVDYKDKDKFLKLLPELLPSKYELVSPDTHKHFLNPFPEIINKEIKLKKKEFGDREEFAYLWIDVIFVTSSDKARVPLPIRFWGKALWMRNAKINWFIDSLMRLVVPFTSKYINKKIDDQMKKAVPGKYSMDSFPYNKKADPFYDFSKLTEAEFRGKKFPVYKDAGKLLAKKYGTDIYKVPDKLITHDIEL